METSFNNKERETWELILGTIYANNEEKQEYLKELQSNLISFKKEMQKEEECFRNTYE